MSDRPNIVFIFTDQQSATAMSCTGNADLHTPHLDALAATGVRFERTYTPYPLCTPARASMMTGRWPHEVGVPFNNYSIDVPTIGDLLGEAGYDCAYGGKWHLPEMSMPDGNGFRVICPFNDHDLPDRCIDFMREERDKPFFLVASFDNPHNICEWGRDQILAWGPIPEVPKVNECPSLPANYPIAPYEPNTIHLYRNSWSRPPLAPYFTPDYWREYRFAYNRLVERVDRQIGRIIDHLRASGLDDNTLIIFSSDHGDMQGAHELVQKSVFYDESVRVPLIVSLKGGQTGAVDEAHLVNGALDIYRTICDYAGVTVPDDLAGRSLRPFIEGTAIDTWHDHVVMETLLPEVEIPGRAVVTERYKYAVYHIGPYREQLFDLQADPGEMVNLAVDARYKDVLQQHRELLRAWCARTNDDFARHYSHPDVPFTIAGDEFYDD
jgi:arylsulfatase A-like enzyme